MKKRQLLGLIVSIALLVAVFVLKTPQGLTNEGFITIGILLAFLMLLVTEALPIGVICILSLALLPALGAADSLKTALSGYTTPILYFVLVSFGISEAVAKVPLSRRILIGLMRIFGKNVKTILLAIMICAAAISSLVSNVPTTAIFMGIGLGFLEIFESEADRKRTGKAIMIAIPVSSMIGGIMTPAGTSLNLLTMDLLDQLAGMNITFVQWMFVGVPIAVVLLPIAWFAIVKAYKPAEVGQEKIQAYLETIAVPDRIEKKEALVIIITLGMLVFWIASSWLPFLDVTIIALFGFVCYFLPGVEVLTWKEFVKSVSWEAFFLVGTVLCIANCIVANGVSAWFIDTVLPATLSLPTIGVVFTVSIIVFLMLLVIPVAPALIAVLAPAMVSFAGTTGVSAIILLVAMGICASNCYLFPLDTVPLITYSTKYYTMMDMPKSTAFIQLALAALVAIWVPLAGGLMGW